MFEKRDCLRKFSLPFCFTYFVCRELRGALWKARPEKNQTLQTETGGSKLNSQLVLLTSTICGWTDLSNGFPKLFPEAHHMPDGNVSHSPVSHSGLRSSGSTARVTSQ